MKTPRIGSLLLSTVAISGWSASSCLALQTAEVVPNAEAPDHETREIEEILKSERWAKAQRQFDQWLSLQTLYDQNESQALKSELRSRVVMMSAPQLESFLGEMEARLAVLLSPEAMEARRWVAPLTDQAVERLRAKYGVEDPIHMPAAELDVALLQFAADRQAQVAGAAAFNQSRETAANSAIRLQQAQQQSLNQAAQRTSAGFQTQTSPYAPRGQQRTARTFSSPYPKLNYSIGPWGGVWVNPRQ